MPAAEAVAGLRRAELVASLRHEPPRVVGGEAAVLEQGTYGQLADERNRTVPPRHVERLVEDRVRRVRRDLEVELRRGQRALVHHVEDDERERVVFGRAVRLRAAHRDGLAPVVVDRTPLPEEVRELLAELGLGGAAGRDVCLVVGPERLVDDRERPRLHGLKVLAEDEVEVDELHHVVGGLRRPVAEARERLGLADRTCAATCAALRNEAVQQAVNRLRRHQLGPVVGHVVLPVRAQAALHPGETERQDLVPLGDDVVEVLPHGVPPNGVALVDAGPHLGVVLLVDLAVAASGDGVHRAVIAVPQRKRGEPVERRHVDRHVVAEPREARGLHDVPRLLRLQLAREGEYLGLSLRLVHARRRVGHVHAPLPFEVARLVRERGNGRRGRRLGHPRLSARARLMHTRHGQRRHRENNDSIPHHHHFSNPLKRFGVITNPIDMCSLLSLLGDWESWRS